MDDFSIRLLAGVRPAHEAVQTNRGNLVGNAALCDDGEEYDDEGELPRISFDSDSVMVEGSSMSVGELVEKYIDLKRQLRQCERNLDNALILKEERCQPSERPIG